MLRKLRPRRLVPPRPVLGETGRTEDERVGLDPAAEQSAGRPRTPPRRRTPTGPHPQSNERKDLLLRHDTLEEAGLLSSAAATLLHVKRLADPPSHSTKALAVKRTWARHCDGLLFVSSKRNDSLPALDFADGKDGRGVLWTKIRRALVHLYKLAGLLNGQLRHRVNSEKGGFRHHLKAYDWFYRADDDTYVVMDRLRRLLAQHDPARPVQLGCKFKVSLISIALHVSPRQEGALRCWAAT